MVLKGTIFENPVLDNTRHMKHISLFLLSLLVAIAGHSPAQTIYPGCIDGTIYFKAYDTSTVQLVPYNNNIPQLNQVLTRYNGSNIRRAFHTPDPALQNIYRMDFTNLSEVDSVIYSMQQIGFVEYAEKVDICLTSYTPNDLNPIQWHLQKINAPAAWNITTGSPSVVIAIVDNAVTITHPDLAANIWTNTDEIPNNGIDDDLNGYVDDIHGYDVADDDNNPSPPLNTPNSSAFNHGTHCAGIASAVTNNGLGIASIGFNVKIMAVKCSPDTSGGSQLTSSYEGIDYAMSAGADIISMSFGSSNTPFTGQLILDAARARGIVLVAAAGNSGSSNNNYPAAFNNVIGVGATDQQDQKASFSNYGSYVDVMAPGVNIYSTISGPSLYGSLSGTSMATPLVAGLAGLVLSRNSSLSPADVETLLEAGCDNINIMNPGYIGQLGAGRINAYKTLNLVPVSVNETLPGNTFTISPNPSNGHFSIVTDGSMEGGTLRIFNMMGQAIYEQPLTSKIAEVDHQFITGGVYLVEVTKSGKAGRIKVIIQ
jgi:serine protease